MASGNQTWRNFPDFPIEHLYFFFGISQPGLATPLLGQLSSATPYGQRWPAIAWESRRSHYWCLAVLWKSPKILKIIGGFYFCFFWSTPWLRHLVPAFFSPNWDRIRCSESNFVFHLAFWSVWNKTQQQSALRIWVKHFFCNNHPTSINPSYIFLWTWYSIKRVRPDFVLSLRSTVIFVWKECNNILKRIFNT